MFIKLNYKILLFAPWFVKTSIFECNYAKNTIANYSALALITAQWLIVFVSGNNVLLNLICANFYVIGLLVGNLYLQLNEDDYPENDKQFLRKFHLKFLVAIGSVSTGYLFADIPKMIYLRTFSAGDTSLAYYHFNDNMISKVVGVVLILWIVYSLIDKLNINSSFERSKQGIYTVPLNAVNKLAIYLYNLIILSILIDKINLH